MSHAQMPGATGTGTWKQELGKWKVTSDPEREGRRQPHCQREYVVREQSGVQTPTVDRTGANVWSEKRSSRAESSVHEVLAMKKENKTVATRHGQVSKCVFHLFFKMELAM